MDALKNFLGLLLVGINGMEMWWVQDGGRHCCFNFCKCFRVVMACSLKTELKSLIVVN